jgi:pyruvate ferredoxin oxidoreductase beta subunit
LYEIENGVLRVTKKVNNPIPVEEYLGAQKRFRHLKEEQIKVIQDHADAKYEQLISISE